MSTDTPLNNDPLPGGMLPSLVAGFRTVFVRPVTTAAFWMAVVLPFVHLPLLVTGLETTQTQTAFAALLALNVLAAVVGHHHGAE
jgi:hypothetical protein